mmetsp:Transcript_2960/g.9125  ORF Transcript_2960/g.9125 Transcript_2960/m.9125 type:complete len:208 (-) Transcript_2960:2385-3008(-)
MTPGVVVVNNNLIKPIVDATRELDPLDDDHPLQTTAFLGCCRLFLPVLDALGVAFKPAKADVGGNVERLSKKEKEFENLFDILLDEKKSNSFAANTSCSKGLLWLKRFLEFVVVLVSKLAENQRTETKEAASYAYAEKLKPFHGWVSSSAFSVVLQFPPARKGFVESLGGEKVLETDGKELVEKFGPVLKHIDEFLTKEDLNDPSKV